MFENLTNELASNPLFWAIMIGVIRNILGYIENLAHERTQKYDTSKLAETLVKWVTLMTFISQWLPIGAAAGMSFLIDILTSAIKSLKQTSST